MLPDGPLAAFPQTCPPVCLGLPAPGGFFMPDMLDIVSAHPLLIILRKPLVLPNMQPRPPGVHQGSLDLSFSPWSSCTQQEDLGRMNS